MTKQPHLSVLQNIIATEVVKIIVIKPLPRYCLEEEIMRKTTTPECDILNSWTDFKTLLDSLTENVFHFEVAKVLLKYSGTSPGEHNALSLLPSHFLLRRHSWAKNICAASLCFLPLAVFPSTKCLLRNIIYCTA